MSGKIRWTIVLMSVLFIILQFVERPAKTNPVVDHTKTIEARTRMTPEVATIFERSCNDCHSNSTRWPWYSHVAPISWMITDHVRRGRFSLNFSEWPDDPRKADFLLREICGVLKKGIMPIRSYTMIHHQAKLEPGDVGTICNWTIAEQQRLAQANK